MGQERIANELLVKLGLQVSPRTVRKYLPKRPTECPRGDQRWSTFLKNHAQAIVACDLFVCVTSTFQLLYVLVVMEHHSRRLIHCKLTAIRRRPGRASSCARPSGLTPHTSI